ncbi:saccharopine dehydrogenase family protein [Marinobacter sp.]|uniref:saccharopine dehydrogenase family protein n=1 Tax=Marinobacter sp. TaxID=50741 RepID=UPI002B4A12C3|nr:saccharopine dehydrogenase NADP-binding domain-containing protein [Marinobacter sp.]HKK57673.1 saccharopine dehydrogenase NADP-binding domain-containing protein [Marinobacter sp.]
MNKPTETTYDIVVFGATSFVGQILTDYLLQAYGAGKDLKWAVAGRSRSKLDALKTDLGEAAAGLPVIIADASDEAALQAMCDQTRVVISTVGPYALFGEPLVKVCAETGTDYCDLTGEVQWIRKMIEKYEDTARASGARIVHCCGFDSIPSDMGVWFLQQQAEGTFGVPCQDVRMRVKAAKGEFSGGTVASLVNAVKEAAADPALRKQMANPFSLSPAGHRSRARQPNLKGAEYDKELGVWLAPFVMSAINNRVVHRSNALQDARYGKEFTYDEAVMTGRGLQGRLTAYAIIGALAGFLAASAFRPSRWVVEKFVPKAGEGPSPEVQEKGYYDLRFVGKTEDGKTMRTKVVGKGDPGYGSTSRMLGEAGVCLAFDVAEMPGGIWTPASLMGTHLFDRLTAKAGLSFEVLETG